MERVERISVRGPWMRPVERRALAEVEADKGWVELAVLLGVDAGHIVLWRRADGRIQRSEGGTPQRPGRVDVPADRGREAWRLALAATHEAGGRQIRRPVAVFGGAS